MFHPVHSTVRPLLLYPTPITLPHLITYPFPSNALYFAFFTPLLLHPANPPLPPRALKPKPFLSREYSLSLCAGRPQQPKYTRKGEEGPEGAKGIVNSSFVNPFIDVFPHPFFLAFISHSNSHTITHTLAQTHQQENGEMKRKKKKKERKKKRKKKRYFTVCLFLHWI